MDKFNKPYDPKETEEKIYKIWEKSGYFNPDNLPVAKPKNSKTKKIKNFCIIMPPPNANGSLHLGHALMLALEDIMIRYKRMSGFKTLWLPGADHAGFETQVVYEKKLEKEGRSRFQISREQLWQEIWDFTQANKATMENQIRRLGASCDWSREKFTLDNDIISKTQDTFIQMYDEGLVYRGKRLVNWCIKHQTGLSDLEVKHEERKDPLYYIKYGPITLATVRLETKFGDTAIAVHPKDERYKKFVGKEIEIETLIGKTKIKVIADNAVDPDFGTGAVKVTPAHDPTDFEIWQRHKDEISAPIEVIDQFGKMNLIEHFPNNEEVKKYHGLKILEARKIIAEEMEKRGLLFKVDNEYKHNVGLCYKCSNILEPRLMPQWFVKMEPLAKEAVNAVKKNEIKFIPERFKKIYFHWLKNIRDWNISRQIVWGIQIPAWFCENCNEAVVSKKKPLECKKCRHKDFYQDPDVFDTWFSSGQWPFFVLGYPDAKNYKNFYPTSVMETGWDILFFWVARMIMLGLYKTKKAPFQYVYLHGLVRDQDKKKMSKSKGNVIDPLGIVNEYGADALRMALIIGNTPGNDPVFSEDKVRGYRNFANKIWQATRFILINSEDFNENIKPKFSALDKKRFKELADLKKEITKLMESYKFYTAAEKLYHYFWHTFADKIIEENKSRLNGENKNDRAAAQALLVTIFNDLIKMLHPFMPFITEEIYGHLSIKDKPRRRGVGAPTEASEKLLIIEKW
ncbi:MAG: valine--tRNA ligase [Patescibacteria group bacterium]